MQFHLSFLSFLLTISFCFSFVTCLSESYSSVHSSPPANPRTLVLLDNRSYEQSHSDFFSSLRSRGHDLELAHIYEDAPRLEQFGAFHYDNLLLLAPEAEDFGEQISIEDIVKFHDSGRGVLIAGGSKVSEPLREILDINGIDVDEDETAVQDKTGQKRIKSANIAKVESIVGNLAKQSKPVYFSGLGHSLIDGLTRYQFPVLRAEAESSVFSGSDAESATANGAEVLLSTIVQTENNGRLAFAGSIDMCSNEYFGLPNAGNREFCDSLARWAFFERGLLRARDLLHQVRTKEEINPRSYRVSDEIRFSVVIEEFDGETNQWKPLKAADVQLEFTMIDPHIRTTLKNDGNGKYFTEFTVPDNYGVFKFVINYVRPGYTKLLVSETVSVHPYRHDEYERYILAAFPYYASAFSIMAAFFVFGFVFLYSKE